jgi:hypothetical protein
MAAMAAIMQRARLPRNLTFEQRSRKVFKRRKSLHLKIEHNYLDTFSLPEYTAHVGIGSEIEVLKFLATQLAVRFTELLKQFPDQQPEDLNAQLQEMANAGLLRVRKTASGDPILVITADGSKKVDSLRNQAVAAFVGARL